MVVRKLGPVTIDPRRHDAVLFDTTLDATQELVRQLQEVGVGTGVFGGGLDVPIVAAGRLAVAGPVLVVSAHSAGVTAARESGFALIIGVDRTSGRIASRRRRHGGHRPTRSACAPGTDACRSCPTRYRHRPGCLVARQPAVFFDFDGTLSDIVEDPDAARLALAPWRHQQKLPRAVRSRCSVAATWPT
ncbi:hypothetical protein ACQKB2_18100 [Mycobacterium tuberculosis]